MEYEFKHDTHFRNKDISVWVTIDVSIATEKNYAGVDCGAVEDFTLTSVFTEQGEDVTPEFKKTGLEFDLICKEVWERQDKIMDQYWSRKRD